MTNNTGCNPSMDYPPPPFPPRIQSYAQYSQVRGFYMRNSHRYEFDTGMTLWFHIAFTWRGHFILANMCLNKLILLLWRAILDWMLKTMHVLSQESDFTPEWTVIQRLHDIGMSFCTRIKISLQYSNWGELAPVWLALVWDFVLVSCKLIQSHKREPIGSKLVLEKKLRLYHVNTPLISTDMATCRSLLLYISFMKQGK